MSSARHAQEAGAFYEWTLECLGAQGRIVHAPGLFRILLAKRLPSMAWRLFRALSRDRSLICALSSLAEAVFYLAKSAARSRLRQLPGARRLKHAVTGSGFQTSSDYWQRRYQRGETSGVGSYGKYAAYKAEVLNAFVREHRVSRIAEIGCGDGNQLRAFVFEHYLGIDVSPAAIEQCRGLYRDDATKQFVVHTGTEAIEAARQFRPELVISLDVIYHLVEDTVFEDHMRALFDLGSRYVIVYSTNFDRRYDSPHQIDRRFTDYVEARIKGWKLLEVLANPHKGRETQSDFYIYERIQA